ncbi:TlpA family protein disulfide reductase [Halobacteria archaeon AArc-dxtr1]|nr:TlpA family protein disulfide reductase [Halobacteria archaeon AArc-dxtr1]
MRRREALAGAASLGVLGTAGAAAAFGVPWLSDDGEHRHDPVTLSTIDAPGSEAGEVTVPVEGQVTFVDLFATTCTICEGQMSDLREASERVDDDVAFVSITNESENVADDDRVAEWWDDHGGAWTVARDPTSDVVVHYGAGTPRGIVFDEAGRVHWEEGGAKTADEVVEQIERVQDDGFL